MIMRNDEKILQLIQGFMVGGDAAVARQLIDSEVVSHSALPGQAPGVEGVIETFSMFRHAFSDFAIEIHQLIAAAEKVVSHVTVTGKHSGSFMGNKPSGNPISYEEMTIFRFNAGKIVEHWAVADAYSLMQQMGMIPMQRTQ
jgi:predicted ester cyclase